MYAFHSNQIRCTYFFATTLNLINSKILGNFTKLPRSPRKFWRISFSEFFSKTSNLTQYKLGYCYKRDLFGINIVIDIIMADTSPVVIFYCYRMLPLKIVKSLHKQDLHVILNVKSLRKRS